MSTSGPHPGLDLVAFARATVERSVRTVDQARDGLDAADLYWQPHPEANSMGWLVWHLCRRLDYYSSRLVDEPELWAADGWDARFGLAPDETGIGHTPGQVAAFHPPVELLVGYRDALAARAVERLDRLPHDRLDDDVDLDAGRGATPRWRLFNPMIADCLQHLGQVAYLRGLRTGRGWFTI